MAHFRALVNKRMNLVFVHTSIPESPSTLCVKVGLKESIASIIKILKNDTYTCILKTELDIIIIY